MQDLSQRAPLVAAELGEREQTCGAGAAIDDVVLVHRRVEHPSEDEGGVPHPQGGVRAALENDGEAATRGGRTRRLGSRSIPAKSNSLTDRGSRWQWR